MGKGTTTIRAKTNRNRGVFYCIRTDNDADVQYVFERFQSIVSNVSHVLGSSSFLLQVEYEDAYGDGFQQGDAFLQFFVQESGLSQLVSVPLPSSGYRTVVAESKRKAIDFLRARKHGSHEAICIPEVLFFSQYDMNRLLTSAAIYSVLFSLDNTQYTDRSLLLRMGPRSLLELYSDFSKNEQSADFAAYALLANANLPIVETDSLRGKCALVRQLYGNVSLVDIGRGVFRGVVGVSSMEGERATSRLFLRIDIREFLSRLCLAKNGEEESVALDVRGCPCLS